MAKKSKIQIRVEQRIQQVEDELHNLSQVAVNAQSKVDQLSTVLLELNDLLEGGQDENEK